MPGVRDRKITLIFISTGRPVQNAYIERFNRHSREGYSLATIDDFHLIYVGVPLAFELL